MKTLNVTFEITNEELFNEMVIDVDASGLKYDNSTKSFKGSLEIQKEDGNGWITTTGEFGANDYKEELGFILITE